MNTRMNRRIFISLLLATSAFAQDKKVDPAFAPVVDESGLPRVLIIGDSISIGYTAGVRGLLAGKANVHRNAGNAESTVTGLAKLEEIIKNGEAVGIQF